jgi:hypothetical protein
VKPQLTTSAFGSVFAYGSFDHLYEEINMTVPGHFSTRAGNADEMSMRMMHLQLARALSGEKAVDEAPTRGVHCESALAPRLGMKGRSWRGSDLSGS